MSLSGLAKPIKSGFSRLCCFHQASSNCIVFALNGVWKREVKDNPVRKSVGDIEVCSIEIYPPSALLEEKEEDYGSDDK